LADIGIALELGATKLGDVAPATQHHSAQGDAIGRDETTGAAGNFHGEGLRMTGAEGLDDAAPIQRLRDERYRVVDGGVGPGEALEARRHFTQILGGEIGHIRLGSLDRSAAARRAAGGDATPPRTGRRRGATAAPEAASSRVVRSKSSCAISR